MTRTVVITGCSGGIGRAMVNGFHHHGWYVRGLDRTPPPAELPLDDFVHGDIGDVEELTRIGQLLRATDRVDALVNNAAVAIDQPFRSVTLANWHETIDVNVRAAFFLTQHLLDQLAASAGAVVNVSSVHAVATTSNVSTYATSKGALVALSRALAVELAAEGVRINSILPGAVDTPMLDSGLSRGTPSDVHGARDALAARTPLGAIGSPAQIAEAALFLADRARSGFITGQALVIDGGATAQLSTEPGS